MFRNYNLFYSRNLAEFRFRTHCQVLQLFHTALECESLCKGEVLLTSKEAIEQHLFVTAKAKIPIHTTALYKKLYVAIAVNKSLQVVVLD